MKLFNFIFSKKQEQVELPRREWQSWEKSKEAYNKAHGISEDSLI